MTSDLSHRLPMRWSDLDTYGHVNNVVYLTYAAEARETLVDRGMIDAEVRPVTVGIDFLRPMPLSLAPVVVDQQLDGQLLEQVIWQEHDGQRVEYARVQTHLDRTASVDLGPSSSHLSLAFRGRRGDLAVRGRIDEVRALEYFQEARILALKGPNALAGLGEIVLARIEMDLDPSITWRPEPWQFAIGVSRIGSRSLDVEQEWSDGAVLLGRARCVLVTFDPATQRSRPMTEAERSGLAAIVTT